MATSLRWILAFDSSCGACRGVAQAVSAACGDKLEVLPLANPEVTDLRASAFDAEPPWTPTLLRVADDVRAWTGVRLSARLVRLLGPRATMQVLRSLGELRAQSSRGSVVTTDTLREGTAYTRKDFLQRVGLGAVMVSGIVISGSLPASADPVDKWKQANAGKLPTKYSELKLLPVEYRRAAYQDLTAQQKSAAWVQHLDEITGQQSSITPAQSEVMQSARKLASSPATFNGSNTTALEEFGAAAREAFGPDSAGKLFATLGPAALASLPYCSCNKVDDFCSPGHCAGASCRTRSAGCGTLWAFSCNGMCYTP